MALDASGDRAGDIVRGRSLSERASSSRLLYLDWLRGLAVTWMVLAHSIDSWTREADRHGEPYYSLVFLGGVASPLFLFLAGVALVMSATSKARQAETTSPLSGIAARGAGRADGATSWTGAAHTVGANAALWRGFEVLLLGLAFRVQSQILGWGPLGNLLKVDMLNVMGLSMMAAALIWRLSADRTTRVLLFAALTGIVAFATPIVRTAGLLAALPDPIEAYLRPAGGYSAFTVFPWAGFLFAGAMLGELLDALRTSGRNAAPVQMAICLASGAGVLIAWWASFRPALYPKVSFWHDSPAFFFIRLGLVSLLVPTAWIVEGLSAASRIGPVRRFFGAVLLLGRSSLFVYWVHVEMVYGVVAEPIKRTLPIAMVLTAWLLLCVGLYALVLLKNRLVARYELMPRAGIFAAVLR